MMPPIHLYTIGFTQKSAEQFFGLLKDNNIDVLVDIRRKPDSQLSGFAKARDLPYFLSHLIGCEYRHELLMAPTEALLDRYRADKSWEAYEREFHQQLEERRLIDQLDKAWWVGLRACLLCSEHEPDHCHRRLVAEYMAAHWAEVQIHHLM
jgi:uncharacterized protein (DUF488 family)